MTKPLKQRWQQISVFFCLCWSIIGLDKYGFATSFISGEGGFQFYLEGGSSPQTPKTSGFRSWMPKRLRPGVSPRSMCQIHQFGDCLVVSAIFFEIFCQGDAMGVRYIFWINNPGFSHLYVICLFYTEKWFPLPVSFFVPSALHSHEEMSGLPQIKGKMVRSLCTRLKGKEGRFLLCRWSSRWAK